jgi:hypothetical protein
MQSQVDLDVAVHSREGSMQPMNVDKAALDPADEIATRLVTEELDATPPAPMYAPISVVIPFILNPSHRKAPSQIDSDGISRLNYLKSLSTDEKWISALDLLKEMSFQDVGTIV